MGAAILPPHAKHDFIFDDADQTNKFKLEINFIKLLNCKQASFYYKK
jgi:hypothetical protein